MSIDEQKTALVNVMSNGLFDVVHYACMIVGRIERCVIRRGRCKTGGSQKKIQTRQL